MKVGIYQREAFKQRSQGDSTSSRRYRSGAAVVVYRLRCLMAELCTRARFDGVKMRGMDEGDVETIGSFLTPCCFAFCVTRQEPSARRTSVCQELVLLLYRTTHSFHFLTVL